MTGKPVDSNVFFAYRKEHIGMKFVQPIRNNQTGKAIADHLYTKNKRGWITFMIGTSAGANIRHFAIDGRLCKGR